MKNLILLLITGVWMSSCTSYVPVRKTLAPEITLPGNRGNFLFLDRFEPNDLEYNNENKIEVYDMGQRSFEEGLKAGFDTSRFYSLALSDTIIPSHSAHEPANNLMPDFVFSFLSKYNQDYLLSLDNYNLYFDQNVEVVEEEDGSKNRTAYYDLVVNTYITIYAKDGTIVDKIKDELRIMHDNRSVISGLLAAGPSMGKADKNAVLISDELGRKFIQKFYPLDIHEERLFFTSSEFSRAHTNYIMQNWAGVESELLKYTENSDTKISGRAAYNLAVLYENQNRPKEMEHWYKIAKQKLGDKTPHIPGLY